MKRKKLWYIVVVYCIVAFIIGITTSREKVLAKERKEIDLSLTPKEMLLDVTKDMKPGDWAKRSVRVNNDGTTGFLYTMSAEFTEGSKKLYDGLTLEVKDKQERVLYKGSLSGFTKQTGRILSAEQSEQLQYIVRFPEELGNEYQGLEAQVKFVFYAEEDGGHIGEPKDFNGSTNGNDSANYIKLLPRTGADYMYSILIGIGMMMAAGFLVYGKRMKRK
ncbi:LPXTG cell wall anchor domain-containing protein [Bacillus sp. S10(2024)]|uniref:LPXTG cell wall anchor domain-containing protein n=1 Tax=Bacillus sp. S10(2024) TaxID=3162886 RepID=UPI003D221F88